MKRKFFLRVLSATLVVLLLGGMLGCTTTPNLPENPDDKEDPKDPFSEETVLIIARDGQFNYQIVRSDLKGRGTVEQIVSVQLRQALGDMVGASPAIGTDYDGEFKGFSRQECEFLIGKTNREESDTAYAAMGDYEYSITIVGSKICICGVNDRALQCAMDDFLANYLKKTDDGIIYVSREMNVLANSYIAEGTYFEVKAAGGSGAEKYDEALALACLQGIMNRESPARVYVNSGGGNDAWLKTMQEEGRWLHDVNFVQLNGFVDLMEAGGADYVKAVVIWDENVAATVNVATTAAGVEDGIALTRAAYQKYKHLFNPNVKVVDLVDKFDGTRTGSAKNDAYMWAIEEYLLPGCCSTDFLAHYMDSWNANGSSGRRNGGDDAYVSVRDWAVYQRAFVIDLSPWADEAPLDDPGQKVGTDYATFVRILEYLMDETGDKAPYEMCGFFDFSKYSKAGNNTSSKHDTVPTEWEYVWLISHYNGYHNTCIEWSWNESFHSQYTGAQQLKNNRPDEYLDLEKDTTYLCFFMADYDSTYPLYRFMQDFWNDPKRGELPLAWGINPNLLDTYPDIIEYYYETATKNDYFTSDASCAGYINPSRVRDEFWDIMIEHNLKYFKRADMSIAPMVLDQDRLDEQSLEAFYQFAPDGLATIIIDQHGMGGSQAPAGMYEEMPFDRLDNSFPTNDVAASVRAVEGVVRHGYQRSNSGASLSLIRCVWVTPSYVSSVVEQYKAAHPNENVVVVDIYNYFFLLKQDLNY